MKSVFSAVVVLGFVFTAVLNCEGQTWTRFRGPNGTGVNNDSKIPSEWSSEKNLAWRAELPGWGTSSPIVTKDHVFLTCYTGYGMDSRNPGNPKDLVRHLLAFERKSGKEVWRKSVKSKESELPYRGFITQHGYASSTPVTDGKHVYVLFGKSGLYCYDLKGNEVWNRSLGKKSDPAKWGDGTSPILYKNMVVVNAGILGNQFVAVNKNSGDVVWKIVDPGFTNCWSTPTVVNSEKGDQILFAVPGRIVSVDPKTGKKNWEHNSPLNDSTCACIVSDQQKAYLMGSRMGAGIALDCSKAEASQVWKKSLRSGIDTPVLLDGQLYWHSSGVFYSAKADSGEYVFKQRIKLFGRPASFPNVDYSSPIAVDGKIVLFARNGESFILNPGAKFDVLKHNKGFEGDDSAFSSTPAADGDQLFVRSYKYLYAIQAEKN